MWLGITPVITVAVWATCVPIVAVSVRVIISMTCCWRRTVLRAQDRDEVQSVLKTKTTCMAWYRAYVYLRRPTSSYFIVVSFVWEIKEFIVQSLAVDQMSRSGVDRVPLAIFTTVILLNGLFGPALLWWITRRFNEKDGKSRRSAHRWISRMLLFDASCDLFYR